MATFQMSDLSQEDRDQLQETLIQIRNGTGNQNPLIPLNVDLDGDGIVDSFGLDAYDNVVLVPGTNIEETVYRSDGDDILPEALDG